MVCKESYGVLPCSEGVVGSIFLLLVYGFIVLKGARWISIGSEQLLEHQYLEAYTPRVLVLDPGIIGGLLLPILGALPDTFIVGASGVGGTQASAQDKVDIGLGALAGANVMLLSLVIGGAIVVGRCDIDCQGTAIDKKLTKGWHPRQTGVTVDRLIKEGAIFMLASVVLLFIPQLPAYWGARTVGGVTLAGMILCFLMLGAYVIYQVIAPSLQRRRMRAARHKLLKLYAIKTAHGLAGGLVDSHGNVNEAPLRKIFRQFDHGRDGRLDGLELKALVTGMTFGATGLVTKDFDADFWLEHFSTNPEARSISEAEFVAGMKKWVRQQPNMGKRSRSMAMLLRQVTRDSGYPTPAISPRPSVPDFDNLGSGEITEEQMRKHMVRQEEMNRQLEAAPIPEDSGSSSSDSDSDDEGPRKMPSRRSITTWAVIYLLVGMLVIGVASDPLVEALASFSEASGIPQFFVSFVVAPLASNAQESVSSFIIASRKKRKNITLAMAQVYGSVTLNNSMALGVFLAIVHFRELRWTFDSEVTVILIVCLVVGFLGITRTTYPLWLAYVLVAIHPLSIAGIAILDYGAGWKDIS